MKKSLIFAFLSLFVLGFGAFYFYSSQQQSPSVSSTEEEETREPSSDKPSFVTGAFGTSDIVNLSPAGQEEFFNWVVEGSSKDFPEGVKLVVQPFTIKSGPTSKLIPLAIASKEEQKARNPALVGTLLKWVWRSLGFTVIGGTAAYQFGTGDVHSSTSWSCYNFRKTQGTKVPTKIASSRGVGENAKSREDYEPLARTVNVVAKAAEEVGLPLSAEVQAELALKYEDLVLDLASQDKYGWAFVGCSKKLNDEQRAVAKQNLEIQLSTSNPKAQENLEELQTILVNVAECGTYTCDTKSKY